MGGNPQKSARGSLRRHGFLNRRDYRRQNPVNRDSAGHPALECAYHVPGLPLRLYPNQTQERQFVQLCGAARFVYNELLAEQIRNYQRFEAGEAEKPGISPFDFGKQFTQLRAKDGNEWLRELSFAIVRGSGAFPLATAFAHFSADPKAVLPPTSVQRGSASVPARPKRRRPGASPLPGRWPGPARPSGARPDARCSCCPCVRNRRTA